MNKNEMYITNQPKHVVLSLVVVDNDSFPLIDSVHSFLIELSEKTDIVFLFSPNHSKALRDINYRRFSNLYQSCGFIVSPGESMSESIIKVFNYSRNIFKTHVSFAITSISKLHEFPITVDDIIKISGSSISKPIFQSRVLYSSEMFEIYKDTTKAWWNLTGIECFFRELFKVPGYIESELVGMYSTWYSTSPIMFFRPGHIDMLIELFETLEGRVMFNTFHDFDPGYMLASVIHYLGIDIFDCELTKIKV